MKHVEWKIWPRSVLVCVQGGYFRLAKHQFAQVPYILYQMMEDCALDTIQGYYDAARDDATIDAWVETMQICLPLRFSSIDPAPKAEFDSVRQDPRRLRIPSNICPEINAKAALR